MSRLVRPFPVRALLAAPVLLGLVAASLLARPERQPRKVAFLVGIEKYRHAFDPALFAERDVRELAKILAPEWEIVILTGEDATLENINKRLETLIEGRDKGGRLRQSDVILLSFCGHGLQMKLKEDSEDAFFCPVDAVLGKPQTMLSLSKLVDDTLGPLGSRNLILVDACRNDPDPNRGSRGLEGHDMKLPRNTAILFGCGRGEKSHGDGKAGAGHGLFTYAVLKGPRGEASRGGKVSWGDLVSHVQQMMDEDEEIKGLLGGARQTPILASGELPDTVLLEKLGEVKRELPKTLTLKLDDGVNLELVRIDPGEFLMGAPDGEKEAGSDEKPRHRVKISKPFYLGKYEFKRSQFRAFARDKGYHTEAERGGGAYSWNSTKKEWELNKDFNWKQVGYSQTDEHPVVCVSWNDAVACCEWLEGRCRDEMRRKLGEGQWHVKLPTEAQWEYACRAGTTTPFHFGEVLNGKQANCNGNYPYGTDTKGPYVEGTTPGGKYNANDWGLYDMHGNALEWCEDYYDKDFYRNGNNTDPVNLKKGNEERRVLRGGTCGSIAWYCRAAVRDRHDASFRSDDDGFRVALRLD